MKENITKILDKQSEFNIGYICRGSFLAGYCLAKHESEVTAFYEKQPDLELSFSSAGIVLEGATREQLTDFLLSFGGNWNKEINDYYPDKMNYRRDIRLENGIAYSIKATEVTPPDSCKIVEVEEDVPATKRMVKKIVCPEPTTASV